MTSYANLYDEECRLRQKVENDLAARTAEYELLKRFIIENDLEDHLADWATGCEMNIGARLERYAHTLEIIAGQSQDKLHMVQAKGALDNIGAKVA